MATVFPSNAAAFPTDAFPAGYRAEPGAALGLRAHVLAYERRLIAAALAEAGGNQRRAARVLGILPTTLHEKLKRLGLRAPATQGRRARRTPTRRRRRSTRVGATGFGLPTDKERAAAAGFDHHVTKPADARLLGAFIAEASRAPASG